MKLSNQALGAIMLALQIGIMEQKDITEIMQDFELEDSELGLVIKNPPILNIENEELLGLFDEEE